VGISWHHNPSVIRGMLLLCSGGGERFSNCGCQGMEGARGPLLGIECELRAGPETISSGSNVNSGQGPRFPHSGLNVSSGRTSGLSPQD